MHRFLILMRTGYHPRSYMAILQQKYFISHPLSAWFTRYENCDWQWRASLLLRNMKTRRKSCYSTQKVSFYFNYKSPVENASLLLLDYCLIFIHHQKLCWEHEMEPMRVSAFKDLHLIRQMGKNTQVWFPVTFISKKLAGCFQQDITLMGGRSGSPSYCAGQWTRHLGSCCY